MSYLFKEVRLIAKQLGCPLCGSRIIDADEKVKSEVRAYKQAKKWKADYYMKCWKCKSNIGLKKLNS